MSGLMEPSFADAASAPSRLVKLTNDFVKFAKSEFFPNCARRIRRPLLIKLLKFKGLRFWHVY
ncbi:hypothetical protein EP13_16000 [Alteromonas australica]|uniref:Uncharacterized protein n=1 Tax=Alteromonas australica TaxID=589873 RepID=A0A075P9S6_9ALTE|nr:hypothetical protein EP13_16000 [Alteromonas australica]